MPDPEFTISISEETLNRIRKAAAVLGHSELAISGEDGVIWASILDDKDATSMYSNSSSHTITIVKIHLLLF